MGALRKLRAAILVARCRVEPAALTRNLTRPRPLAPEKEAALYIHVSPRRLGEGKESGGIVLCAFAHGLLLQALSSLSRRLTSVV